MKRDPRTIALTLWRCLKLQCPACGRRSIFARPFNVKAQCTDCRVVFQREEGFFVGALSINVVTTELVVLIGYMFCQLVLGLRDEWLWPITFAVALLFPIAFYHHSWSLWLSLDHLLETLPQHVER